MSSGGASRGLRLLMDEGRAEAAEWRHHAQQPTAQSRRALFDRYRNFALKVSGDEWRRIGDLGLDRGDTDQLAYEALLGAIDRFDPHKGVPFTAYARIRLRGTIRNALPKATEATAIYNAKKRIERDRLRSLKHAADSSSDEPLELLRELAVGIAIGFMLEDAGEAGLDVMPSADPSAYDAVSWQQLVGELNERLGALPDRERMILEYHYKQDIQFTEIAKLLGVSKGRISQIHSQALKRLRTLLSKFR
ncbi:sigma-70 family RNA polymerase sigma factor [Parerythrobacter jejuensis]|uniref:Sigma-70 family RNA polymerase sigma factor n=1 Tax=Parerythrobacter jejuensis TaxID=795812 RepID=A0A845AJZ1_9SPHN|nr:sigma-70 family RNA polymerase sigma factor [Parerythrobacter jejuensis]MXP30580.1 sigma-70 family RNA polymerase sigma factor [Parerythrobacter jejuensis]MXP33340.1 sigma-70 family RNA polymerase sigma factor [Parerythrobacter jejuensis]